MQKSLKDIFKDIPNIDPRSAQFLINALEKNNIDGFDYIEYKQALGALAALDIDEATAFKSAFATASMMGLSKDKLLKTANFYLKVLQQERSQFDKAVEQQVQRQVAGKQKEGKAVVLAIQSKKDKISQLQSEILQHQEQIVRLQDEIESSKDKIGTTKSNFEQTYGIIEKAILSDIDKVQVYLK